MSAFVIDLKDEATGPSSKILAAFEAMTSAASKLQSKLDGVDKANKKASAFDSFAKKLDPSTKATSLFADAAGSLGAALNPTTLAIAGIGAAAALATGLVVGTVAGLWEMVKASVAVNQSRARVLATFDAITDGAGKQALEAIGKLSERLPFSSGRMREWAKTMAAAGIRDVPSLRKAVIATAAAQALMGDESEDAGGKLASLLAQWRGKESLGINIKDKELTKKLFGIGLEVKDLANAAGVDSVQKLTAMGLSAGKMGDLVQTALIRKGKKPMEEMNLTWDVMTDRLKSGAMSLFSDLGGPVEKLMTAVGSLFSEFFKGSDIVKGAKPTVTAVMTSILETMTKAVDAIHDGFLDATIAVLTFALQVAPLVGQFRRLWAEHDGAGKLMTILKGIGVVAALIAIPIVIAGVVIGATMAVLFAAIGYVATGLAAIPGLVVAAFGALAEWVGSAWDTAKEFVQGLADGITAGASKVWDAVKGLGSGAVSAIKSVLQISSPSRVMFEKGMFTSEGLALGIESGASRVANASQSVGIAASDIDEGAAGGGRGRGGRSITVGTITITNHGVDSEGRMLELTEESLASILERVALQRGLAA